LQLSTDHYLYTNRSKIAKAKKYYFLAFLIVVPAIIFGSFWYLDTRGFFAIESIELKIEALESQKSYSSVYVDQLSNELSKMKGRSLWRTSLSEFSQVLKKQAWIQEFHTQRSWPAAVEIKIIPKKIVFITTDAKNFANGLFHPVSERGDLLPLVDTRQAPPLAHLNGEIFAKNLEKRKKAIELLQALPAQGKVGIDQLSEVNYDPKFGFWIRTIRAPYEIHLGEDQFELRAARVSQVIDYLEKRDLKARVIDANLTKKVLVRMQQSP
jgi:cell division protein FtsQ